MRVEEVASAPRLVIEVPQILFFFFWRGGGDAFTFFAAGNCNRGTKAAKEPLFFNKMRHFCFCAQMNHKWRQCNITCEADVILWCKFGLESIITEELYWRVCLAEWLEGTGMEAKWRAGWEAGIGRSLIIWRGKELTTKVKNRWVIIWDKLIKTLDDFTPLHATSTSLQNYLFCLDTYGDFPWWILRD